MDRVRVARLGYLRWALFAAGLAASIVMARRAQIELDQFALIVRGWMLAKEGWLVPFGALTAAGGFQPGALSSLLMGLPLLVWEDYRAIGFLTLFTHIGAYWLLDRTLKDVVGARGRLVLCIVYWLNPWRLFYSAHVWNPNLVFLPAVLHLSTAMRSRQRASFLQSFGHVLAIGIAFQLHASFLVLAIASLLLFAKGYLRVHWGGFVAGVAVALGSLANWAVVALRYPGLLPINTGFIGSGLVQVGPVLKGAAYWLRYPTAAFSSKMSRFDFGPALGDGWDAILSPLFLTLVRIVGPLSVLVAVMANVWLWRRRPRFGKLSARASSLEWLLGYSRWVCVSLLLVMALNPAGSTVLTYVRGTTSWRGFIALPAAVLPVVLWLGLMWRTAARKQVRLGLAFYAAATVLVSAALSVAAPMYRKGGDRHLSSVIREHHEMLDALGMHEHATIVIDAERGFKSELVEGPRSLQRPPPFPRM